MAINGPQIESRETKADLNDALANTPGQPIRMLPKKKIEKKSASRNFLARVSRPQLVIWIFSFYALPTQAFQLIKFNWKNGPFHTGGNQFNFLDFYSLFLSQRSLIYSIFFQSIQNLASLVELSFFLRLHFFSISRLPPF